MISGASAIASAQPAVDLDALAADVYLLVAHDDAEPLTIAQLQDIARQCADDPRSEPGLRALATVGAARLHLTDQSASELAASIAPYRKLIAPLQEEAHRAVSAMSFEADRNLRVRDFDRYLLMRSAQRGLLACLYRAETPASFGATLSLMSDLMRSIRNDISRGAFSADELDRLVATVRAYEPMLYSEAELTAVAALVLASTDTQFDGEHLRRLIRRESRLAAAERAIPGDPLAIARALSPMADTPVKDVVPYLAASVLWKQDRLRFEIRATLVHAMAYHYRHTYSAFPVDIAAVRKHVGADEAFRDPIGGADFVLWRLGKPPDDSFMLYSIGLDGVDNQGVDGGEWPLVDHEARGDYIIRWRG